jgi:hypothetical protein
LPARTCRSRLGERLDDIAGWHLCHGRRQAPAATCSGGSDRARDAAHRYLPVSGTDGVLRPPAAESSKVPTARNEGPHDKHRMVCCARLKDGKDPAGASAAAPTAADAPCPSSVTGCRSAADRRPRDPGLRRVWNPRVDGRIDQFITTGAIRASGILPGRAPTATGRTRLPAVMRSSTAVRPAMSAWRTVTSSKEAGQSGRHQPAGGSAFGPHPNAYGVGPTIPKQATEPQLPWSAWVWSPPPESNWRPHPYHGIAGNRCAQSHFRRSRCTVEAKVITSASK